MQKKEKSNLPLIENKIENSTLPTTNYIVNVDFSIPKELYHNFQGIFSYIKKKYQINFSRKSQIDSLLKKSKGKFFKAIHEAMNKCLKFKLKRLPQSFITNITIVQNQKYLNKTIIDVYKEFKILSDYEILVDKNLVIKEKEVLFKKFCSYNIYNLYLIFTESKRFKENIKKIKFIDGKRIGLLYEFVAINFCDYYKNTKPYDLKSKGVYKNKNENNKLKNDIYINYKDNSNNNYINSFISNDNFCPKN